MTAGDYTQRGGGGGGGNNASQQGAQTRVLTLNFGDHLDSSLYRLKKGMYNFFKR
jgi:hypothetical protein